MANHPEILDIVKKKVGLEAFGNKILADIKSSSKFLGGHMVWITNGLYKIDDHIKFLQDKDELNVKLMIVFKNFEKNRFFSFICLKKLIFKFQVIKTELFKFKRLKKSYYSSPNFF